MGLLLGATWGISRDIRQNYSEYRETEEEVNLHGSRVSRQVYRDSWMHKGVPMARYTFPLEVDEQLKVQRTWCDRKQQPVGRNEGPIRLREYEHLD